MANRPGKSFSAYLPSLTSGLDMARPIKLSAIVVYWREARHAGGPGLCECADLWHVSQDRRDGRRADAFERLHEARSVDRIRAAVICAANAVHMTAPAERHHAKKTLATGEPSTHDDRVLYNVSDPGDG